MLQRGSKDVQQRQSDYPEHDPQRKGFSTELDKMFDDFFKRPFLSLWSSRMGGEELYPPVDMFEDGESLILKAEIPGMRKEDIDVQVTPDRIIISGQKSNEEKVEQKDFFRLERSYGSFTRSFTLPVEVATDQARANFRDGVLEVRIPKSQTSTQRVKKITVD